MITNIFDELIEILEAGGHPHKHFELDLATASEILECHNQGESADELYADYFMERGIPDHVINPPTYYDSGVFERENDRWAENAYGALNDDPIPY